MDKKLVAIRPLSVEFLVDNHHNERLTMFPARRTLSVALILLASAVIGLVLYWMRFEGLTEGRNRNTARTVYNMECLARHLRD